MNRTNHTLGLTLIVCGLLFTIACNGNSGGPNISMSEKEDDAAAINPDVGAAPTTNVQKLTYKLGPFTLTAGQKAIVMWESPGSITFQAEEPLWVTSFTSSVEDESGGTLPDNLLHMAVLSNGSEKNPFCADKEVGNPFIAATSTTKDIELPDGVGYPVLPTDQLDAKVILQNPTTQDFSGVYFKFTITALSMKAAKNYKDVMPMMLNVDPCDYAPMAVAPKEFVKKNVTFTIPEDGLLTKAYGLLQDYGVEVSLTESEQPTPFWEAKAELSSDHKIISLAPFEDPAGIPLKAGDEISLGVAYDNPADQWQSSATGAVMAYLTRTDDSNSANAKSSAAVSAVAVQETLLK